VIALQVLPPGTRRHGSPVGHALPCGVLESRQALDGRTWDRTRLCQKATSIPFVDFSHVCREKEGSDEHDGTNFLRLAFTLCVDKVWTWATPSPTEPNTIDVETLGTHAPRPLERSSAVGGPMQLTVSLAPYGAGVGPCRRVRCELALSTVRAGGKELAQARSRSSLACGRRFESCTAHFAVNVLSPVLSSGIASGGPPRRLDLATPSLQIRPNGGLSGSGMVKRQRTSNPRLCVEPALVGVCRRDLTRIWHERG
jgi:hypothetical protein